MRIHVCHGGDCPFWAHFAVAIHEQYVSTDGESLADRAAQRRGTLHAVPNPSDCNRMAPGQLYCSIYRSRIDEYDLTVRETRSRRQRGLYTTADMRLLIARHNDDA